MADFHHTRGASVRTSKVGPRPTSGGHTRDLRFRHVLHARATLRLLLGGAGASVSGRAPGEEGLPGLALALFSLALKDGDMAARFERRAVEGSGEVCGECGWDGFRGWTGKSREGHALYAGRLGRKKGLSAAKPRIKRAPHGARQRSAGERKGTFVVSGGRHVLIRWWLSRFIRARGVCTCG